MTARRRLPDRRLNVSHEIAWAGHALVLCIGYDRQGRAREAFLSGHKIGSQLQTLMNDACVMVSLVLQHGEGAAELVAHLGAAGEDTPSSLPRLIAATIAAAEVGDGPEQRAAYAAAGRLRG